MALGVFIFLVISYVHVKKPSEKLDNKVDYLEKDSAELNSNQDIFKVQSSELPRTDNFLFGREAELSLLDQAWASDKTNIVVLEAFGGAGKTALINKWVNSFNDASSFRGAQKVYKYSFYMRGSVEDSLASADEFFEGALQFFGYEGNTNLSAHTKGLELAKLVSQQKTLLVLDGLEPLQHRLDILNGELKDRGLKALLQQLAIDNQGLCLISTRQSVVEIEGKELVVLEKLQRLDTLDGVNLLKAKGVIGKQVELENAVEEVEGHALALNLLGGFVLDAYAGDIRQRDKISTLYDDPTKGSHAKNVMAAYEKHLDNTPELHVLYLLSLFSRPASKEAFEILLNKPLFKADEVMLEIFQKQDEQRLKFSKIVKSLSDVQLGKTFRTLRQYALINKDELNCHPLIRDYFEKRLKEKYPNVWQLSHMQLYEYYKTVPEDEFPETLKKMEPLFAAVVHGCAAGLHNNTDNEVYYLRILRKDEQYLTRRLGAFGTELTLLSGFFEQRWSQPLEKLDDNLRENILANVVKCLRALGRYQEAEKLLIKLIARFHGNKNWEGMANELSSLSGLQLIQGKISQAIVTAKQSLEYAEKVELCNERLLQLKITSNSAIAYALFQFGETASAKTHFVCAEKIQKKSDPKHPQLYSTWGFEYGDLLIAEGEWTEVRKRAKKAMKWWAFDFTNSGLLDRVLDPLLLARAIFLTVISEIIISSKFKSNINTKSISTDSLVLVARSVGFPISENKKAMMKVIINYLNQVIDDSRSAGAEEFIVQGLLVRAKYYRFCQFLDYQQDIVSLDQAIYDLSEIYEIAHFGGMRLALVDYYLESCRLALTVDQSILKLTAREHINRAIVLIEDTGYKRRLSELKYLEELILSS